MTSVALKTMSHNFSTKKRYPFAKESGKSNVNDQRSQEKRKNDIEHSNQVKRFKPSSLADFSLPTGYRAETRIRKPSGRREILYFSPEGKSFTSLQEVFYYVTQTGPYKCTNVMETNSTEPTHPSSIELPDKSNPSIQQHIFKSTDSLKKLPKKTSIMANTERANSSSYPIMVKRGSHNELRSHLEIPMSNGKTLVVPLSEHGREHTCPLTPKELEENITEEERIGGLNWIGRKVECFWAYPLDQKGYYSGEICDYRRSKNDTEYLVKYDEGGLCEWELVDEGMRFVDPNYSDEIKKIIELRKKRGKFNTLRVITPSASSSTRHTPIGSQYQVDIDAVLGEDKKDKDLDSAQKRMGLLVWNPNALNQNEVTKYLELMKADLDLPDPRVGKTISFIEDKSTTTQEEALDILHRNDYDIQSAVAEMRREGIFWTLQKPLLKTHWTSLEVTLFELAMKTDPKNFREIRRRVRSKSLQDVIQFFWYWKTTARYKEWRKKDRFSIQGSVNFTLDHHISFKNEEVERNPRLRKRPRVDYSYSNLPYVRESNPKWPSIRSNKSPPHLSSRLSRKSSHSRHAKASSSRTELKWGFASLKDLSKLSTFYDIGIYVGIKYENQNENDNKEDEEEGEVLPKSSNQKEMDNDETTSPQQKNEPGKEDVMDIDNGDTSSRKPQKKSEPTKETAIEQQAEEEFQLGKVKKEERLQRVCEERSKKEM
jgi:hypothetical protein